MYNFLVQFTIYQFPFFWNNFNFNFMMKNKYRLENLEIEKVIKKLKIY